MTDIKTNIGELPKKNFVAEILKKKEQGFGRLHIVKKSRKSYSCRICKKIISIGELNYTQNDYTGSELLPTKKRVCFVCSKKLIEEGVKVVEK